jgi:hypothetical protein
VTKVKDLDYDKMNVVKVIVRAGFPTPFEFASPMDVIALNWNPFNRSKDLQKVVTAEKVFHVVSVEKLYFPIRELKLMAEDLCDYFVKYPVAKGKAEMFDHIGTMRKEEIIYLINTWMAIVSHFGNTAHYRREFLTMMNPLPDVRTRVGL